MLTGDDRHFIAQWARTILAAVYAVASFLGLAIAAPHVVDYFGLAETRIGESLLLFGAFVFIIFGFASWQQNREQRRAEKRWEKRNESL